MLNINKIYHFVSLVQLTLLSLQGIVIIVTNKNNMVFPIWLLLGIMSLLQVLIVFKAPQKIETNKIVDRASMIKIRLIAVLPYALIIFGLLATK